MKTIFLIDGFNFYHPIDAHPEYHRFKWLDFSKLVKCFIPKTDSVSDIIYFSAETRASEEKRRRQKVYLDVLKHLGIKIVLGEFKKASRKCKECGKWYKEWNEKLTDVNLASTLIVKAFNDEFEKAIIVCADFDITPAVHSVKHIFPSKRIEVVIPLNRKAEEIKKSYDRFHHLKIEHLESSLLPPEISISDRKIIKRPPEWL